MIKNKIIVIISFLLFLSGCGVVKEGFKSPKQKTSDEFLVEKKSPLVMPPDYNELLIPKQDGEILDTEGNKIKKLVKSKDAPDTLNDKTDNSNESFTESILKKIKKN